MRLELQQVSAGYQGRPVVSKISFVLDPGQIGCLLGPSGSGKTTLLRAIAGFEPLTAGNIRAGERVLSTATQLTPPERRDIGLVFQDFALLPHLSVADNVGFGLFRLPRSKRAARVREMLALVGLSGEAATQPHCLSGGQQQRVALARALAPRPSLLLLDEPFSSLDPELRERLCQDVRRILQAEGVTALLVTHGQTEAFAMADRIGVIGEGRLHQWASPYDLYHCPADRFVAGFIGEGVLLPAQCNGSGMLRTELGPASCPRCEHPSQEVALEVLVRPDDVIADDRATHEAQVVHRYFRGPEILYTLRLPSGREVLALMPSHDNYAVGQNLKIRLDLEHVVVFPAA